MGYRYPTFFHGVLELLVAANLFDFVPAVFLQSSDQLTAVHRVISYENTHFLHTRQFCWKLLSDATRLKRIKYRVDADLMRD